jgi:shikimate dehydrogenase
VATDPTSRRFAVIGDPVSHSRSPLMHAAAYDALGLRHTYEALRVAEHDLPAIVAALRRGEFGGLNVTVPHKERVLPLVDALDDSARSIGAANTLVRREDGRVVAHNTDTPALAAELRRLGQPPGPWARGRGLVLGSGGAARAAVGALAAVGVREIVVRARAFDDPARREAFARGAPSPVVARPLSPSRESERETVIVVQATSAGMKGADPGETVAGAVAWDALGDGAVAVDVVYGAPGLGRVTPFLRAARARGLRCDDGLGMLARQGALAFELWLGVAAPVDVMRAALD